MSVTTVTRTNHKVLTYLIILTSFHITNGFAVLVALCVVAVLASQR